MHFQKLTSFFDIELEKKINTNKFFAKITDEKISLAKNKIDRQLIEKGFNVYLYCSEDFILSTLAISLRE